MILRALEIVFFLYFASHIPITLFIDLQALLPQHVYPQQVSVTELHNAPPPFTFMRWFFFFFLTSVQLKDVLRWYSEKFKDPMVVDPPEWFKSFIFCEALIQLPFFPIAAYAFLKGGWNIESVAGHFGTHFPHLEKKKTPINEKFEEIFLVGVGSCARVWNALKLWINQTGLGRVTRTIAR